MKSLKWPPKKLHSSLGGFYLFQKFLVSLSEKAILFLLLFRMPVTVSQLHNAESVGASTADATGKVVLKALSGIVRLNLDYDTPLEHLQFELAPWAARLEVILSSLLFFLSS